jgi:phage-related protein
LASLLDHRPSPRGARGGGHRQTHEGARRRHLRDRPGDAYRAVYAVQLGDDLWVVHAFQKKSKSGIKTPKQDVDLLWERIKRLKEQL